ncbi:hypothetical protein MRBLWO14_001449 [Microbacterium sp. LWO14-1.2]|uniref:hypothetical protein n=1 Tax=Microbacterium sp. LWO14-1.2 TaxID=3135263 RepID=UPI003138691F
MHSRNIILVGRDRDTWGPAGLTQGVYGTRGNLELVACDAAEGLWVFWFNADSADDPLTTPDVPPGAWSSGLGFADGSRYVDAQIVQSTLGPDHLEVVALTAGGVLESWYWSPGPGFQRRAPVVADGIRAFRLTHRDGELEVAVESLDGGRSLIVSPAIGYPERFWSACDGAAPLDDDAAGMLAAHGIRDAQPGTVRSARSSRDGGTTELTWRDADGGIRHLGIPD